MYYLFVLYACCIFITLPKISDSYAFGNLFIFFATFDLILFVRIRVES